MIGICLHATEGPRVRAVLQQVGEKGLIRREYEQRRTPAERWFLVAGHPPMALKERPEK